VDAVALAVACLSLLFTVYGLNHARLIAAWRRSGYDGPMPRLTQIRRR
jgi:hypothetical protein